MGGYSFAVVVRRSHAPSRIVRLLACLALAATAHAQSAKPTALAPASPPARRQGRHRLRRPALRRRAQPPPHPRRPHRQRRSDRSGDRGAAKSTPPSSPSPASPRSRATTPAMARASPPSTPATAGSSPPIAPRSRSPSSISKSRRIVARAPLASAPDYVRFVAPDARGLGDRARQEAHRGLHPRHDHDARPQPTHAAFIDAPGGPESLVIDATRGRAYTHKWKNATMAIDLQVARRRRHLAGRLRRSARHRPRRAARALLFIGCEDGTATALDVAHDGKLVGTVKSGSGVDIIAYDAGRAHLYVPGDESATRRHHRRRRLRRALAPRHRTDGEGRALRHHRRARQRLRLRSAQRPAARRPRPLSAAEVGSPRGGNVGAPAVDERPWIGARAPMCAASDLARLPLERDLLLPSGP